MMKLSEEKHKPDAPLQQRIEFHYSKLADWIDTRSWYHDSKTVEAVKYCIQRRPFRILELCCGSGLMLEALDKMFPGTEIVGVDISTGMTRLARARIKGKPNLSVYTSDWIYQLPSKLSCQPFDVILVKNALHLLCDLPTKLKGLRSISHQRTTLVVVETVSPDTHANEFIKRLFEHVDIDDIKQAYFTKLGIRRTLRDGGWEIQFKEPLLVKQYINVEDWLIHKCSDLIELMNARNILQTKDQKVRKAMEFAGDPGKIPSRMLRLQYIAGYALYNKNAIASKISDKEPQQLPLLDHSAAR